MSTDARLQAIDKALQLEIDGIAFYRKAAAEVQNTVAKEMFAYLADAEVTHMDRIKKISESIKMAGKWCKTEEDTSHNAIKGIFENLAKKNKNATAAPVTEIMAIDTGLDLEVKSIDLYTVQLKGADDANEKAFYTSLIEEETAHFRTLKDMKFYLEDPGAWYAEHEHHGLDGA